MKSFVKAMDDLNWVVKLLLCLPVLDIVWAVYRIVKGAAVSKNVLTLVFGILWIIPGSVFAWLIDFVCVCIWKEPRLFVA